MIHRWNWHLKSQNFLKLKSKTFFNTEKIETIKRKPMSTEELQNVVDEVLAQYSNPKKIPLLNTGMLYNNKN